jgi:uncharacterized membrane protein
MQHLTVLAFPNPTQAFPLREALVKLNDESLLELVDAVVVIRDADGNLKLHQSEGAAAGCAAAGSVTGMIVGAIFAQPWAGSLLGMGIGAIIGARMDLGINDQFMKDLGTTITPGTSALFLLGGKMQLDKARQRLKPLLSGCTLLQTTVNKDCEDEIRKLIKGE